MKSRERREENQRKVYSTKKRLSLMRIKEMIQNNQNERLSLARFGVSEIRKK
jgi:hypothetical protein